ncbi:hypothetical protein D3C81_1425570 [compost metagenome]
MGFAVHAQVAAVGIDDGDTVETRAPGQFVEADRQHHLQLFGELLEMGDGGVGFNRGGQLQVIRIGLLAEVRSFEQLLDQDDLRALGGRFADQPLGSFQVALAVPGAGHLGGGNSDSAAHLFLLGRWLGRQGQAITVMMEAFISDKYRL